MLRGVRIAKYAWCLVLLVPSQWQKKLTGRDTTMHSRQNPELCIGCANCAMVCPDGVITVYKTKYKHVMEKELRLMKGNEAVAEAAIRAGVDGYFGYPITPQTEIIEYLMEAILQKQQGW